MANHEIMGYLDETYRNCSMMNLWNAKIDLVGQFGITMKEASAHLLEYIKQESAKYYTM